MTCSIPEIISITNGTLLGDADLSSQPVITNLLTDSRNIGADEGSLFFAISTEANDGMRYIPHLYARGVRAFVVATMPGELLPGARYILVTDVIAALQKLCGHLRQDWHGTMIGITGSRGKTIVKEWIFRALEHFIPAVRSPRSFNSQIGVPLSLWQLAPEFEAAIIEAGISRTGEMEHIASIIQPAIAVITNVGSEHADGFKSPFEQAAEKAILAAAADTIVYCSDDYHVAAAVKMICDTAGEKLLLNWSRTDEQAAVKITKEEAGTIHYTFRGAEESLSLPFEDKYLIDDAMHALCALLALGMEPARAAWALRNVHPVKTRIDVSDGVNDCLLAYDAFTCDLPSLYEALNFTNRRADEQGRSRTLILADMLLDSATEKETCEATARLLRLAKIDRFIGVGEMLCRNAGCFPSGSRFFADEAALMRELSTSDFSNEFILIKCSQEIPLTSLRLNLEARTHETVLEVNLDSIVKNYNYFRASLPHSTGLIAMVKASGYGAGSLEIAKTLQAQGAAYLAVAVLDEGVDLRHAGITMPIMVMNPKVLNYKAMFAARLEPEIYSLQMLRDVVREAGKCGITNYPVHIKLDTGMHRMGFNEPEFPALLELLNSTDAVKVSTLFSHLATADCPDMDEFTLGQLERFEAYTTTLMQGLPYPVKRHVLNSAGILRFPRYHYDFARLGIGLYGVNTLPPEMEKPLAIVSTLRTQIIALKERKKGEAIGYARRDILQRDSVIATIPIGYADGMNRRFGNGRSKVIINGHEAPTIGNICMDACMIDVTDVPCREGDPVEIFGENMSVQALADILDTIPYEILTSISPRVKRIYFHE